MTDEVDGSRAKGKPATVADALRQDIRQGVYQPGERLPVFPVLMAQFGVASRSTISEALRALAAEGLIETRPRMGVYVRDRAPIRRDLVANLLLEYRRAATGDTSGGLFERATGIDGDRVEVPPPITGDRPATSDQAAALHVADGSPLRVREWRFLVDEQPHMTVRSYLPAELADAMGLTGLESEQKGAGVVARLMEHGIRLRGGRFEVSARLPTETEAQALAIPANAPVIDVQRVLYDTDGRAVELSTSVVRGDNVVYDFAVDFEAAP